MAFYIGDCSSSSVNDSEVKNISHIRQTHDLKDRDVVNVLGHVLRWDTNLCVSEETCRQWRTQGDPLCDAALETIFPKISSSVGHDLLASLEDYVAANPGANPAREFLNEISQLPPSDIEVTAHELKIAQDFFVDHSVQIMQALLHYSLAAGFASPRIVRTLQTVSYLVPPIRKSADDHQRDTQLESPATNARTYSRLLETFKFVLDVMGCMCDPPLSSKEHGDRAYILPGGEAWRSAVRVRMLHGVARRRARERLAGKDIEGDTELDVPVSQEDMSATLVSFSTVPIWALTRLHLTPPATSTHAYLALWRHIGFYLGISPSILSHHLCSPHSADKFLASIVLSLFSSPSFSPNDELRPLDPTTLPTLPILRAISHRPPLHTTLAYNIALTSHLTGPALSSHLSLPSSSLFTLIKLHLSLLIQKYPVWFARLYTREGWREKRRTLLREGMARSVVWGLGMRHTEFRPRTDTVPLTRQQDHLDVAQERHGELGGTLADSTYAAERATPNPARARWLKKAWRAVLVEMAAVSVVVGLSCGVVILWCVLVVRSAVLSSCM